MKAEFYFDHRRYICSLVRVDSVKELKIKNCQGLVLAVKQGQKVGLIGKTRQDARQVDVSQAYFYNLIKAAMSALDLASKDEVILDKNRAIADAEKIIQQQTREISVLNEQMNMLIAQLELLSAQQLAQQQESPIQLIDNEINEITDSEISQEFDRPSSLQEDLPIQEIENEIAESEIDREFDRPSNPLADCPVQLIEDNIADSEIARDLDRPSVPPADFPNQLIENELADSEIGQEFDRPSDPLADLSIREINNRISDAEIPTPAVTNLELPEIENPPHLEEIAAEEESGEIAEENVNPEILVEPENYAVEVAVRGKVREVKGLPRRASNRKMRKKS
jgi:hypothetical protein